MINNIRNFCIIAHIDHGKSTLADRFLELTGTVEKRKMKEQVLDRMDLERERGITIKLQPVRMEYFYQESNKSRNQENKKTTNQGIGKRFILNLIDTPGHVDFTYEVSRSLAAVEGAILLVDAAQGIQAQTLANYYLAVEQGLKIIPVINKIDLAVAEVEKTELELMNLLKCDKLEILKVSAKTGQGVEETLEAVVERISPPGISQGPSSRLLSELGQAAVQALVFDSVYDDYRGVVVFVRLVSGEIKKSDEIYFIGSKKKSEVLEVGYFKPDLKPAEKLSYGEIGYVVTGLKDLSVCQVGDTIIKIQDTRPPCFARRSGRARYKIQTNFKLQITNHKHSPAITSPHATQTGILSSKLNFESLALPGYKKVKPMVFAGFFCQEGTDYKDLREGLEKIKLTDAALSFEPESSQVLGAGFRCGFLGLLHLDIIQERLRREHNLDLVVTAPSVAYLVTKTQKTQKHKNTEICATRLPEVSSPRDSVSGSLVKTPARSTIRSPQELPGQNEIEEILEPWVKIDILTPEEYIGQIMKLASEKRGIYLNTAYLSTDRLILHYEMPLYSILTDFYDKLKSVSSGYASLNYDLVDYRSCQVERLDILVADQLEESLSMIVYRDEAYHVARKVVDGLKDVIPKQMFEVKIQAVLGYQNIGKQKGGKVIASSRIPPYRKDVTAKLYGGDVTRKMKLLEKQKKGKKKMRSLGAGRVEIPTSAYLAVLKR